MAGVSIQLPAGVGEGSKGAIRATISVVFPVDAGFMKAGPQSMKSKLKELARTTLRKFDIGVARYMRLQALEDLERDVDALLAHRGDILVTLASLLGKSRAQLHQDLFVLSELGFKRNGYFVEFGATNGIDLSNTCLLEKEFGWTGILAEPARCWHRALMENRTCTIETSCVWRESNSRLTFNEADTAELSTLVTHNDADMHAVTRTSGKNYDVNTISLNDLLQKYGAPREIDYLSIDTEGSEFEILSNFDFDQYRFKVITCEHNFTPAREKIFNLLTKCGYTRKHIGFSKWDDWYVTEST